MIIEALDNRSTWVEIYICNSQEISTLGKCAVGWRQPTSRRIPAFYTVPEGSPTVGLGWWVRKPPCLWVNQAHPRPCSWDPRVTSVRGTPWAGYQPLVLGLQRSCVQLTESSRTPPWAPCRYPQTPAACPMSRRQSLADRRLAGFCLPPTWPLVLSRNLGSGGRGIGLCFFWPENNFHTGPC